MNLDVLSFIRAAMLVQDVENRLHRFSKQVCNLDIQIELDSWPSYDAVLCNSLRTSLRRTTHAQTVRTLAY